MERKRRRERRRERKRVGDGEIEREKVGEKLRICSVSERTTYIQYLQKY